MDNYYYEIALSKVKNIGPVTAKLLIGKCGSAQQVFQEKKSTLKKLAGIPGNYEDHIDLNKVKESTEAEIDYILKNNIKVLYYLDDQYPSRLRHYTESPILLFYKGIADLNHPRTISVVGTRNISEYGKIITQQFVEGLTNADVLLISGLAYGVDSAAHRTCLNHKVLTIGVLGHGLDKIYPYENKNLAEKMVQQGGLLSQFGIRTKPDRENFPLRNRIVAALSDAVVVVESKKDGGSIITAEFANEYNKDVFAFPGRVNDECSEGCNELIKQNKAILIQNAQDVLDIMQWIPDKNYLRTKFKPELVFELNEDEKSVVQLMDKNAKVHIDQIHKQVQLTPGTLASILLTLEFRGVIRELPGKFYLINQ